MACKKDHFPSLVNKIKEANQILQLRLCSQRVCMFLHPTFCNRHPEFLAICE
jgi:hypothetical protein